ncbi:MAG: CPBP family intramembrane glutamic endopeptidase [Hyphomicrobiales bacterium]
MFSLPKLAQTQKLYAPDTPWGPFSAALVAVFVVVLPYLTIELVLTLFPGGLGDRSLWPTVYDRTIVAGQACTLVLIMLVARMRGGTSQGVLADAPVPSPRAQAFIETLLLLAIALGLTGLFFLAFPELEASVTKQACDNLLTRHLWLDNLLLIILFAPLVEEFLFRGFLFSAWQSKKLPFIVPALSTSLLWTALHFHYDLAYLPFLFLDGMFLSWILWRHGSIWLCVSYHMGWNAVAVWYLHDCIF